MQKTPMAKSKNAKTSLRCGAAFLSKFLGFGMALFLFSFPGLCWGEEDLLIAAAQTGQSQIFARDYEAARQTFQHVIETDPDHPTGYFGMMALWETRMLENSDFAFEEEYLKVAEKGLKIMDRYPAQKQVLSRWDRFILSAGYGIHGFHYARKGGWLRAYLFGNKARHYLKELVWEDSHYYDAYLGLGLYDYYRSIFTRQLWFLPFFGDKRVDAMVQVRTAMEKSLYSRDLARANLSLIHLREGEWQPAESLLNSMLQDYSKNIVLRMYRTHALLGQKKMSEAKEELRKVLQIDPKISRAKELLNQIAEREKKG